MLEQTTVLALAASADAGHLYGADPLLARLDPIASALVRRRMKRHVARARSVTASTDMQHTLRLAALFARGREPEAAYDDVAAVAAELASARSSSRPVLRGPWLMASLALALAASISLGFWVRAHRRTFDPLALPGGVALGRSLPGYLITVDAAARSGHLADPAIEVRRKAILDDPSTRALGPKGVERADAMMKAIVEVAGAAPGPPIEAAARHFTVAATSLNEALAEAHLPFFVDVDVVTSQARAEPWLYAFYVQRDEVVKAGGKDERVVHLLRLDQLNLRQSFLGYTRSTTGAAIVLLDHVETDLVVYVLPGLPPGERTDLLDEPSRDDSAAWQRDLGERASSIVREHFARLHDADIDAVGKLLARRRALVESWKKNVAGLGLELRIPQRLVPEADYHEQLALRVPSAELLEWDDIHDRLLEPGPSRAFLRARADEVASIERHELEHRIDYGRGLVPVPPELAELLGVTNPLDVPPGSLAGRVRDEYSAYLAELASTPSPALELMLLSRFVFDAAQGGTYTVTSYAVLAALARELGAPEPRSRADRAQLAKIFIAITDHPGLEIQAAARRVWERAYGSPLPETSPVRAQDHDAWRR
jgi:hypothetical protein